MQHKKIFEILLVEDNHGDALLTKQAFKTGKMEKNLHIVYDGVEATDFLFKRNKYTNALRPDLIILDINLPKKNGMEVLAEIKVDETLKSIPVIILTSSDARNDIREAYNLHANCYLIKQMDLNSYFEMIHSVENFWLGHVDLPAL